MKYISIDIETTGLDPEKNNILEFAAVMDYDSSVTVENLPYIQYYIHHDLLCVSPSNLKFLGVDYYQKWMDSKQCHLSYAIGDLLRGFKDLALPERTPIAGMNYPSFDHQFLLKDDTYKAVHSKYFGHRYLSPAMFYLKADDETIPGTEELCRRSGVKYNRDEAHDALYDARLVVQLIRNAKYK